MKLFVLLLRLFILTGVAMATIFALNWSGPLTLDNASKVGQRSIEKVVQYSHEVYDWASPHLQPIREQWKHLSRFVAKNGREWVIIAWDKTVHYAQIAQQQALVIWPVVRDRTVEVLSLTGDTAAHYWRIVCREAPVYYEALVDKISQLYQGTSSGNRS